jgi:alpha-D-xyloside xylohydrolase
MPLLVRDGTVLPRLEVTPARRNTDDLLDVPWRYEVFGTVDEPRTFVAFDGVEITWRPLGAGR